MHNTHIGNKVDSYKLVLDYHYSRRLPANIQKIITWHREGGLFNDSGPAMAACFFSIPPTRWSVNVWELSRLVRTEDCEIPLSGLIAEACRIAKSEINLLVSFADQTQGHHGGIYQASSWSYHGKREASMDGVLIDGVFHPGRSCNSKWGTRSPKKLSEKLGMEVRPHYDSGKHLYWRALNRLGQKEAVVLGLRRLDYPKPRLDRFQQGTSRVQQQLKEL